MAPTVTMRDVLAHLARHPLKLADGDLAARATRQLRSWGLADQHDVVSRPLVNMLRHGKAKRAAGIKAQAVWQVLANLKLIPGVPIEALTYHAPTPRRAANENYRWKQKYEALVARLRGGERPEEVREVPMLTAAVLRYFGFAHNPVFDEIKSGKDVWWGKQHQEARALLIEAAAEGRFVRLAGRRGAGKSLVAHAAKEDLARREELILVEPSPTITGVLTEMHLITSILQAIKRRVDGRDEIFAEAQSPAKRALAMRYLLIQQRKANRRVVLWIDEAHELRAPTFLALKRFLDEVEGLGRRLLSIVLIGQNPEAAYNPRARDLSEVTLRLQTYRLGPMHDEIPDYLRFKIARAGGTTAEVIAPSALKALAARCPYPLDANVLFAQLLLEGYAEKTKPIGRDAVNELAPDEAREEAAP